MFAKLTISDTNIPLLGLFVLLAIMVVATHQKTVNKKVTMAELYTNQPIFLARFDFGTDENNITIKYKYEHMPMYHRKHKVDNTYLSNIKIGLLMD